MKETIFKSIFVVILPLISLIQNQQKYLKSVGLEAEFIEKDQSDKGAKWEHDSVKLSLHSGRIERAAKIELSQTLTVHKPTMPIFALYPTL